MIRFLWQVAVLTLLLCAIVSEAVPQVTAQTSDGPIYTIDIQGPVTSVTINYMRRALQQAESSDATALIVNMNSQGGVLRAMRPFAGELAEAEIPVVLYITPAGTNSGAAGTFFLSAAHVSALAPDTSFGSAYPLAEVDETLSQQTQDLVLDSVTDQLRTWNTAQGRNTDWLDQAVRDGAILTNEQAIKLEPPAVDVIAADQDQLLTLLEGRTVTLSDGSSATLQTQGRTTTPINLTLWESFRLALATPTIAFILLILGAIAIYIELTIPGTSVFVGIGGILLIGALAGFIVLPIQWWAMLLLLLALVLIGAEFFVTAHGGLTVAGLALVVVSALNLVDPAQAPGTAVAVWAIILIVLSLGAVAALGVWLAFHARSRPVATGQEGLIGQLAEVRQRLDPDGMVFVDGALWRAVSENGVVENGDWVKVTSMRNLRLVVQRINEDVDET
ncbi:MAG: nodulation protein NfeD [Chloroflexi bacterium AL-N10]|nr:nodulation protein NfeD [Chloroflexi bacterium AL-N1]NOK66718.1 nodulation protein NfeD [Chloroflexi bacterium AL-N10]NOK72106.1 nodulation protein NfeD [Chloroflexi bacterium AL-N5]